MIRPGHHRPLGTVAKMRFTWQGDRLPELQDVALWTSGPAADDYVEAKRAYRVVGIEEGRDREHFKLLLERISWDEALDETDGDRPWWPFYDAPRGR